LAPDFVVDVRMEGDVRVVTFADGRVVPERIVGIDNTKRRMAYAAVGVPERKHHNASFQVFSQVSARAVSSGSPTCCRTRSLTSSPRIWKKGWRS